MRFRDSSKLYACNQAIYACSGKSTRRYLCWKYMLKTRFGIMIPLSRNNHCSHDHREVCGVTQILKVPQLPLIQSRPKIFHSNCLWQTNLWQLDTFVPQQDKLRHRKETLWLAVQFETRHPLQRLCELDGRTISGLLPSSMRKSHTIL